MSSTPAFEPPPGIPLRRVFADRVQRYRQKQGLTQAALAARLTSLGFPIHQSAIARLERAAKPNDAPRRLARGARNGESAARSTRRDVTIDELFAFAIALNVSPVNLLIIDEDIDWDEHPDGSWHGTVALPPWIELMPGMVVPPETLSRWLGEADMPLFQQNEAFFWASQPARVQIRRTNPLWQALDQMRENVEGYVLRRGLTGDRHGDAAHLRVGADIVRSGLALVAQNAQSLLSELERDAERLERGDPEDELVAQEQYIAAQQARSPGHKPYPPVTPDLE